MNNSHRLSSADFKKMRPTKRINGDFFTLSITPSERGLKWACVVSKKVAVKAVMRNRIKRQVRSIASKDLNHFDKPLALVFQAKRGTAQASFADLKADIHRLITRIP